MFYRSKKESEESKAFLANFSNFLIRLFINTTLNLISLLASDVSRAGTKRTRNSLVLLL